MDNKDVIAQSVMQHEGLYKLSVLLDQFKDGLKKTNIEKLIENYPKELAPLFICSGEVRAIDVIEALYMRKDRMDQVSMELLHQYISSLSQQGMFIFVHVICKIAYGMHCWLIIKTRNLMSFEVKT